MNAQTLANILLIVILVGWIGLRQLSWRPIVVSRMWRLPAIMAIVGVVLLAQTKTLTTLSALDIGILAFEIVLSLGVGALMGKIAVFRTIGHPDLTVEHPAFVESRTGWFGLCLWVGLIAVRVGIDVIASQFGSHLGTSTGAILLLLAANRAARTLVFTYRLDHRAMSAA